MKLNEVIQQLSREVEVEPEYDPMYAMLHDGDEEEEVTTQ